jgi:hypothetical protein
VALSAYVVSRSPRIQGQTMNQVRSNNALERTVGHSGPRLAAAHAAWPAAQRDR